MKHLGNVTEINGSKIEPVDIITFGSPCQDMSVAGKREGLKHEDEGHDETTRSGLFYEAIRIIKEMRDATNGQYPKYAVWENVPGAFSSNKGRDFRAVLEAFCSVCDSVSIPEPCDPKRPDKLVWNKAGEIVGSDYSIAWRTLDAQYWGVPQRRKRIFLVADFAGRSAGEILFKCESLPGDIAESRETGEKVTAGTGAGVEDAIAIDAYNHAVTGDIAVTLTAESGSSATHSGPMCMVAPFNTGQITSPQNGNKVEFGLPCHTLSANEHPPSAIISYGIQGSMIGRADKNGPQGDGINEDISFTPNTTDRQAVAYGVVSKGNGEAWITPERHMALNTGGGQAGQGYPAVLTQEPKVYGICSDASNSMKSDNPHSGIYEADTTRTLDQNGGNPACNQGGMAIVQTTETVLFEPRSQDGVPRIHKDVVPTLNTAQGGQRQPCIAQPAIPPRKYIIRRLTPTECARLQGFPDWWGHLAPYDPADAEFWESVRKTHAEINGKKYKPVKDLKKWYDKLHTDSAEYKMWGNGIALPNAEYVIHGIAEQGAKTLGSLFDGSGGFPLAGAMNGIKPIWASEVEPYPIAVTKSRFK